MLQVELRERISTFRFCNSLKRSLASSGMNFALFGSSKMAAATARQKSTSKPAQLPLSSGIEKPGRPVLTPHSTSPRRAGRFRVPWSQFRVLPHDDLGGGRDTLIEIGDVGIDQPEATGRDGGADRIRPVGAVDAIDGGAEVERAGAERVAGAAGHEARQIGLARDHLRRRRPVRPFGFLRYAQ